MVGIFIFKSLSLYRGMKQNDQSNALKVICNVYSWHAHRHSNYCPFSEAYDSTTGATRQRSYVACIQGMHVVTVTIFL